LNTYFILFYFIKRFYFRAIHGITNYLLHRASEYDFRF